MLKKSSVCFSFSELSNTPRIYRRNAFDPPPLFPTTHDLSNQGVELKQANPYLDTMMTPVDIKYGIAAQISPLGAPIFGGSIYFPTGNILRPIDGLRGSYAQSRSIHTRVGMQGGPFLPYQNSNYAQNVREIEQASIAGNPANFQSTSNNWQLDSTKVNHQLPLILPPGEPIGFGRL